MERDKLINNLSGGKGYAFLTSAQKSQVNTLPQVNTVSSANLAPVPDVQIPNIQQTNPAELQGIIQSTATPTSQYSNTPSGTQVEVSTGQPVSQPSNTGIPSAQDITSAYGSTSPADQNQNDIGQRILDIYKKTTGKTAFQQQAETNAQVPVYQKQLTDINSQITALANEARAIPLQIQQENTGLGTTRGGVEPIQTARLRENAIKSLTLSSAASAVQGNLALAQQQADKAVELEFAPLEAQLQGLQLAYNLNKDILEREDKKKADALKFTLDERSRLLEEQKTNKSEILKISQATALAQAPASVIQRIQSSKDPLEAVQFAAPFLGAEEKLKLQQRELEIQKTQAEISKINNEIKNQGVPPITNPQAVKYAGALNVILGSGTFTKEQKASVVSAINSGQDPAIVIKNQAKNIMGQTLATALDKNEQTRDAMIELNSALSDYYAAGGKTGILTGSFEKVANKLGNVNDPGLVDLAVQIQASLQKYRNAISGTAYSEQEGKDIASIFPGINKGEILNSTIVKARLKTINSDIDSAYKNTLGSAYETLKSQPSSGQYEQYRSQLQQGEILVKRGNQIMAITESELQPSDIKL